MNDSHKYDHTLHQLQPVILGLITAADIDAATAMNYLSETFPTDNMTEDDLPSYLRVHGQIIGMLVSIINGFRLHPTSAEFLEGFIDALREGQIWPDPDIPPRT